jgi:hypothetical protein
MFEIKCPASIFRVEELAKQETSKNQAANRATNSITLGFHFPSYLIFRFSKPSVCVTSASRVYIHWIFKFFQRFRIYCSPHLLGKCEAEGRRRYTDTLVGVE